MGEAVDAPPAGDARFHRALEVQLGGVVTTLIERVTPTLIGIEDAPARLDLRPVERDALADLLDGGELVEQQADSPSAATFLMEPGLPAPIQSGGWGFCARRRLDDDLVELPVLAAMGPRRVRRSTP